MLQLQTRKFRSTVRPNRRSRTEIGHTFCLLRHSCYVPTCCRSDIVSTLRRKKNHCNKGILHSHLLQHVPYQNCEVSSGLVCCCLTAFILGFFLAASFSNCCLYGDDVITCADSALRLRTRAWAIFGFGDSS